MKITITADGGIPVTLCDHGREGPSGFTFTPLRNVDVLQFVQGSYSKPKNRGNVLNQITFTVSKENASLTAAQLYLLRLESTIPSVGEVDIELDDQQTHVVIRDATCELAPLPILGVLVTVAYTLKFGRIDAAAQVLDSAGDTPLTADGAGIFVNAE